jgi:penicillin amidase
VNLTKLAFRLLLGRRLPTVDGTLTVDGCRQAVRIRRDRYGVPYIEAQTDEDACYGLGFCEGQDRAFQLETLLRVVRGTLAELFGPDLLPVDRFSRRIGFHRAAAAQLPALDEDVRAAMEAFARGVNDGIRHGCRRRAHEFVLLGAQPTPFTAVDALGVLKLVGFDLAGNWGVALARLRILAEDGEEALRALDVAYPAEWPVTAPPGVPAADAIDRLAQDLALFSDLVRAGGASNNWAVAASRSATGRPILANDPHLAPVLPCQWYLAHVRTPEWAIAGPAFVGGGTAFGAGHNGHAAWGVTAGMVDNTDLFVHELGPDGRSVRQGERWVPCEVRREVIEVKGQDPVVEEVLITPHGPIVSPALEGEWGAISLRATWLAPRPFVGILGFQRVESFADFRRIFEQWPGASLNMAYADAAGTIGWQLIGDAPARRKGWGVLPAAGWDPEVGWEEEPIPFAEIPFVVDPDTGYVATANAKPACDDACTFLGVDWLDACRLARIDEALASRDDWDLDAMQALQLDQVAVSWRSYRDVVLSAPVGEDMPYARQGLDLLARWDGVLRADSPAATVYEFFRSEMAQRLARAKAPRSAAWALGKSATIMKDLSFWSLNCERRLMQLVVEQPAGWFAHGWDAEIAAALESAVRAIAARRGPDPANWAWGSVRTLTLQHAVGGRPPLHRVFNLGPFPWGGDENTVSAAAVDPQHPAANPHGIASMRMVVDLGNWEASRFVLTHGQSGNPLSPHYDDQLPLWQRGEGIPIAWSPERIDDVAQSDLRLLPRS